MPIAAKLEDLGLDLGAGAVRAGVRAGRAVLQPNHTLGLVAVLSVTLAWVAARVMPLLATAHLVVVAPLISSYDADAPRGRFLLARGGTRAPPVAV